VRKDKPKDKKDKVRRDAAPPEVEQLVDESIARWEAGDHDAALTAADRALALHSDSSDAHHCRAAALVELDRLEEAQDACDRGLELAPDDPEALLYGADFYVTHSEGDRDCLGHALALAARGQRQARRTKDTELEAEFLLLEARAEEDLRRPDVALERVEAALDLLGPEPDVLVERGVLLFELCRFDEARDQLEQAVAEEPELADAHFYLGLIDERRGDQRGAARRFRKARRLEPDLYPRPVEMSGKDFEDALEAALASLPAKIRRYLGNVAITIEEIPLTDDLVAADPPLSPQSLGLFRGSPLAQKGLTDPWAHFPNSIVLYKRNLERFASSREELIEQIDITLRHEVGHFLGLDDDELSDRGLA
jgi:predicted Zn-dependent protease with MMP-like domain/Flp pilus assembly protein TadD